MLPQVDARSNISCFPSVSRPDAVILILGSMPGERSLQQQEYYAHPRNAFWPIMARLLNFPRELPYPKRLAMLTENRVALWDVLARCRRSGSLDSAIAEDSLQANDFAAFLAGHPQLRAIFFNGTKAEQTFRRLVLPRLAPLPAALHLQRLPSTSPAHAGLNPEQKFACWRAALAAVRCDANGKTGPYTLT